MQINKRLNRGKKAKGRVDNITCSVCGSRNVKKLQGYFGFTKRQVKCLVCGNTWYVKKDEDCYLTEMHSRFDNVYSITCMRGDHDLCTGLGCDCICHEH